LAVAEALKSVAPQVEVTFAGTRRGLESLLVPRAGYRLHLLPASGFRGLSAGARLLFLINFVAGLLRSLWLLLSWRPAVVLGMGGYVSAPVLAAARLLRRPCALQEQNAIPGSANRLLARWAQKIYLGFAAAGEHFPRRDCMVTGNPVRAAFATGGHNDSEQQVEPPRGDEGSKETELRLLVFGGSRGARTLNRSAQAAAAAWRRDEGLAIWIQTGPAARDEVAAAFAEFPGTRVRVDAYLFDMPAALVWADLAVCRAGAMTLAELAACGKPALLVPYPHATDDHQLKNARDWEAAGAASVLEDAECNGGTLAERIRELSADRRRLKAMGEAAKARSCPDAAERIARDLLQLAGIGGDTQAAEAACVP
jgi:UDP-N-acetylglucosamine--N-acetylmuramyl-(pentapeptide) pyrophosphoryl-undecaprenol N-acetylglucosamine transferase